MLWELEIICERHLAKWLPQQVPNKGEASLAILNITHHQGHSFPREGHSPTNFPRDPFLQLAQHPPDRVRESSWRSLQQPQPLNFKVKHCVPHLNFLIYIICSWNHQVKILSGASLCLPHLCQNILQDTKLGHSLTYLWGHPFRSSVGWRSERNQVSGPTLFSSSKHLWGYHKLWGYWMYFWLRWRYKVRGRILWLFLQAGCSCSPYRAVKRCLLLDYLSPSPAVSSLCLGSSLLSRAWSRSGMPEDGAIWSTVPSPVRASTGQLSSCRRSFRLSSRQT